MQRRATFAAASGGIQDRVFLFSASFPALLPPSAQRNFKSMNGLPTEQRLLAGGSVRAADTFTEVGGRMLKESTGSKGQLACRKNRQRRM